MPEELGLLLKQWRVNVSHYMPEAEGDERLEKELVSLLGERRWSERVESLTSSSGLAAAAAEHAILRDAAVELRARRAGVVTENTKAGQITSCRISHRQ